MKIEIDTGSRISIEDGLQALALDLESWAGEDGNQDLRQASVKVAEALELIRAQ